MKKIKSFQKNKKFLCERTKNTGESWTCGSDGRKGVDCTRTVSRRQRDDPAGGGVLAGTKRGEEGEGALKKCGTKNHFFLKKITF